MVRQLALSRFCSASVIVGMVAKACQYLSAALAPRSGAVSADTVGMGKTEKARSKHRARSMNETSLVKGNSVQAQKALFVLSRKPWSVLVPTLGVGTHVRTLCVAK